MLRESDLAVTYSRQTSPIVGEEGSLLTDQAVHLLCLLRVEWRPTATHLEKQDTERPKVDVLAVPLLVEQNFRCEILGRAAEGVCELIIRQVGL